jgi:hypothetical protein
MRLKSLRYMPRNRGSRILAAALLVSGCLILSVVLRSQSALAYPPAVGIVGQSRDCLVCHVDNGPWEDESKTIIDILDKDTGKSLRQEDGTFVISARRGEKRTVLTVIGRTAGDDAPPPYRNSWLYVDPKRIKDPSSLGKFAPGWLVNLPMACRIVGDASDQYPGAHITVLPMTLRPADDAQDTELELQVMLTKGESVKGKPREGLISNYAAHRVRLTVVKE